MRFIEFAALLVLIVVCTQSKLLLESDEFNEISSFIKDKIERTNIYNERPIIGIWTQPRNATTGYIVAAYVKFVEMAGARVIPLNCNDTDENLINLVTQINGVIYPGGETILLNDDGSYTDYARKGKLVLDKIKEMNDKGIYYPVWGICLGFQEITVIEAPYPDVFQRYKFNSSNVANNVTFVEGIAESKMYRNLPKYLLDALQTENITYNHHHDGVYPEVYKKFPELQQYYVLAVSYDNKDVKYTASIEHKKYPFYGHQYHPEKTAFIWGKKLVIPKYQKAQELMQYYSNFFVNEARKNMNHFRDEKEERANLIQNFKIEFTKSSYDDIYVFPY